MKFSVSESIFWFFGDSLVFSTPSAKKDVFQPVPEKKRLEMLVEIQIEILSGGEIIVN